ncbi:MAG: hypothetical protein HGB12_07720 [Bacteroidetes bacterium]|nr:hypothetical protein [Bacteroidota bacterium]
MASTNNVTTDPNEYILTKHIEAEYFKTAVLPVFTDATSTFYPVAGANTPVDGYVACDLTTTWATTHDASSVPTTDEGGVFPLNALGNFAWSYRYDNNGRKIIARSFFLFDASSLTSSAIISSATFSVYVNTKSDSYGDSYSWFNVVQSSPAGTNNLVNSDYSQCGAVTNPTVGATHITAANITTSSYNDFPLNTTGLTWISKTSITKLGLREGHDATNNEIGAGSNLEVNIRGYFADQTGTTQDPKLVVVYTLYTTPTVTTQAVNNITSTTATGNGNVTADGGATITERGICWNTSTAPTTANSKATSTGTTGAFNASMTGLTASTSYYVRAYAINSEGTSYGNEVTFTTLNIPSLTTPTATAITTNTVTMGANVTSNGGAAITARGTCWGTSANPTTNCIAEGGTTTGVFTHSRTGLPSGTFIYYRGYATNSVGTGYSSDATFTTISPATVDWNNSNVQEITLAANRFFSFTNGKSGGIYTLILKQDGTGGRTVTWPTNVIWDGGDAPALSTAANAIGIVRFIYDGTNYLGFQVALNIH